MDYISEWEKVEWRRGEKPGERQRKKKEQANSFTGTQMNQERWMLGGKIGRREEMQINGLSKGCEEKGERQMWE